jgi:hypothetical protein
MGLAFPGLWEPRDLRVQRTLARWDMGSSAHQDASGKRSYVHVIYVVSGSYCLEWRAAPGQPWQVLWIPAGCATFTRRKGAAAAAATPPPTEAQRAQRRDRKRAADRDRLRARERAADRERRQRKKEREPPEAE